MSGEPAIRLEHVTKLFGGHKVLDDLSLDIPEGSAFCLLGRSGTGKSVTLKHIIGLMRPDTGHVFVYGKDVPALPRGELSEIRRSMGFLFQEAALFDSITVGENVAFPLRVRKESNDSVRQRVLQALEVVGLGGFAERGATQLSGGQQQRVALARALVYEPAILLLDEPLSNLDAKLREQMRVEIRALQKKLGLTVLYVTHDQAEAMTLSDRIAVVNRGRFEQVGAPEEVYEKPATPFVAEFLGRTVSFEGKIAKSADGCWIEFANGAGRCALGGATIDALTDGAMARVFTRPEDVEISTGDGRAANQLAATIEQVAYLGDRFEYHVKAVGVSFVLLASKKQRFHTGDAVRLALDPARLNVRPI